MAGVKVREAGQPVGSISVDDDFLHRQCIPARKSLPCETAKSVRGVAGCGDGAERRSQGSLWRLRDLLSQRSPGSGPRGASLARGRIACNRSRGVQGPGGKRQRAAREGPDSAALTSSAVEQPSAAQAIDVLLAFETAPGSQTGSGYTVTAGHLENRDPAAMHRFLGFPRRSGTVMHHFLANPEPFPSRVFLCESQDIRVPTQKPRTSISP